MNVILATEEVRDVIGLRALTVAEIVTALHVSATTVRRHLALLEERGWARRAKGHRPRGHAYWYWMLTDEGRAACADNRGF